MSEQVKFIKNNNQVTAILPGEDVSFFILDLPDLSDNKLNKIIPSILVDYIAGNINETHFSLIEKRENGKYLVAVCDKDLLTAVRKMATEQNAELVAIWPDFACLDIPEEGINIAKDNGCTVARRADGTGFSADEKFAPAIIDGAPTQDVTLALDPPDGAGLATGRFSPRPPMIAFFKVAKRLTILASLALLGWIIHAYMVISDNEATRLQYADAAIKLFQETYPGQTRIVNVEAQMRTLAEQAGGSGQHDFLGTADHLFKGIMAAPGLELEQIIFDTTGPQTEFMVTVSSTDFAQISVFENYYAGSGYQLEQGGSNQNGDKIFSDYRIREDVR